MNNNLGILFGISLGTGDPELITVKGLRILQNVSVVAFPAGINNQPGLAEKIVTPWLEKLPTKLPLNFPYVQDETILQQAWEQAAQEVWNYLILGQDVAFVCEGDVNFYSTFTYLAQTLTNDHPDVIIKTIAGVCSPMAAVAALGIPLTVKDQSLVILPALYTIDKLEQVLTWADVVVLMKFNSVYTQVWQLLQQMNLLQFSSIVEKATFPEQLIYQDLSNISQLKLSYFSILIIKNKLKKLSLSVC
jgi:precorrin-2/cobalt-factor-2 C20-methyltransferase